MISLEEAINKNEGIVIRFKNGTKKLFDYDSFCIFLIENNVSCLYSNDGYVSLIPLPERYWV